jgi:hypothetical protein
VKAGGFDGRGNYTLGVTEQIIFPEINIDKINKISGMDITFVTNANSDKEAMSLLSELGLPFKKPDDKPKISEVKEIKKEPVVEDPIVEEPAAEEPVAEETAVEDPIVEEPAAAETVVKEPVVKELAAEDEPSKKEEESNKEKNKISKTKK